MQANEKKLDWDIILVGIEELNNVCKAQDNNQVKILLNKYIPEYQIEYDEN